MHFNPSLLNSSPYSMFSNEETSALYKNEQSSTSSPSISSTSTSPTSSSSSSSFLSPQISKGNDKEKLIVQQFHANATSGSCRLKMFNYETSAEKFSDDLKDKIIEDSIIQALWNNMQVSKDEELFTVRSGKNIYIFTEGQINYLFIKFRNVDEFISCFNAARQRPKFSYQKVICETDKLKIVDTGTVETSNVQVTDITDQNPFINAQMEARKVETVDVQITENGTTTSQIIDLNAFLNAKIEVVVEHSFTKEFYFYDGYFKCPEHNNLEFLLIDNEIMVNWTKAEKTYQFTMPAHIFHQKIRAYLIGINASSEIKQKFSLFINY